MRTVIKYFSISLAAVLGLWYMCVFTNIFNTHLSAKAQMVEDDDNGKEAKTINAPHGAFKKYAGTYKGTWEDIGQGRQGTITAVFNPAKTSPKFTFNLEGINGLPFSGIQTIKGKYKNKKAIFKSKNINSYGDTKVILSRSGNITAEGTGLPFGVAVKGQGTIDPENGVIFNYEITQGNFIFDAVAELQPEK